MDEMKKALAVKLMNGRAVFENTQLNFNIPSFDQRK